MAVNGARDWHYTEPVAASLFTLLFLGGLVALWSLQARANRVAVLRRVEDRIAGTVASSRHPLHDEIHGEIHGRAIRLRIGASPLGWLPGSAIGYPLTVAMDLRNAPPALRLRIRKDAGLAAVEKALGLVRDVEVSGGDRFDRRYLVEADSDPAGAPLADEGVRESVNAIIARWDLSEIRIQDDRLTVRGDSRWLGQAMLNELLYELDVLAHAYDRVPAPLIGVTPRFFWVGGTDAAPRCPYCHDGIGDDHDLTACAVCSTLIHGECLEENQGCPILGCGGRGGVPTGPIPLKG